MTFHGYITRWGVPGCERTENAGQGELWPGTRQPLPFLRVGLCNSPGCTGTCLVDQAGLEFREIHLSLSGLDKHCEWK